MDTVETARPEGGNSYTYGNLAFTPWTGQCHQALCNLLARQLLLGWQFSRGNSVDMCQRAPIRVRIGTLGAYVRIHTYVNVIHSYLLTCV